MSRTADNVVRIPTTSINGNVLRFWFEFLRPFHRLTDREIEVLTAIVKKRFQLSEVISDEDILDQVLMSEETKKEISQECNMSMAYFQTIFSKLKKNKIVKDDKINRRYLPNVRKDGKNFKLLLLFELNDIQK